MSRLIIHVGPPKTGTKYLQQTLEANADELARNGYPVIADQRLLRSAASELAAAAPDRRDPVPTGAWDELRRTVLAQRGATAVLSCERFSILSVAQIRRLVEDLRPVEVTAVLTLRDPVAVLPSRWQERVKNGGTETWAEFCARAADEPAFLHRMLRMRSTLRSWTEVLGASRVGVAVVPTRAPAYVLVERFCEVTGIPRTVLAQTPPTRRNESLSREAVEVLRRINAGGELSGVMARNERKSLLAGLFPASARDVLVPTGPAHDATRRYAEGLVGDLESGGAAIVGRAADLVSTRHEAAAHPAAAVPDAEEVVDAAVQALVNLAARAHTLRSRAERAESVLTTCSATPRPGLLRRATSWVSRR